MKHILSRTLAPILLATAMVSGAMTSAYAEPVAATSAAAVPVEEFSVFVDIPTGFAFVKTPAGWRFVRQIEATRLGELHPTTLVSVIQAGERLGQVQKPASVL